MRELFFSPFPTLIFVRKHFFAPISLLFFNQYDRSHQNMLLDFEQNGGSVHFPLL